MPLTLDASGSLPARERAEVARSAVEARLTDAAGFALSEQTIRRYGDAQPDTPFPLEYAVHLLGDVRGRRILDLGAGSGRNASLLRLLGADVIALDISKPLLALAQETARANGLSWLPCTCASAHALPFKDHSVDLVFGNAVLHHLDHAVAAREIWRVLRPGGRAVFREPIRNSRLLRALRRLLPPRREDTSPFERPLTDADLRAIGAVPGHGRVRAFALPPVRLAEAIPALGRWVDRAYRWDRAALARVPGLRRYAAIVVFELVKDGAERAHPWSARPVVP